MLLKLNPESCGTGPAEIVCHFDVWPLSLTF